jgi:hypothetical protein
MNSTGHQTRRNSDSPSKTTTGPGKGTGQATMPPGRTWLWLVGILLVNYLLPMNRWALAGRTSRRVFQAAACTLAVLVSTPRPGGSECR